MFNLLIFVGEEILLGCHHRVQVPYIYSLFYSPYCNPQKQCPSVYRKLRAAKQNVKAIWITL